MKILIAFFFALVLSGAALAVEPNEMLKDPVLEARAREVSKMLRCVVCQNETIDESDADIAKDMRQLLRARILAGDSNKEVIDFLVGRYGDYVLLRPRFMPSTYVLWVGPAIILLLGAWAVARRLRTTASPASPLTPEEQSALEALDESEDDAA